jgi:hypothetical protein
MYGDGNVLGGKLRMLVGLYAAGSSSSGPSKLLRSGVGLLLHYVVAVVLFSGAFSLALNRLPGPHGGSMRLLDDIGVLSYVCFVVLVLVVFCLGAFCVAWLRSHSHHHVGRGCCATLGLVYQKGLTSLLISSMYLVIIWLLCQRLVAQILLVLWFSIPHSSVIYYKPEIRKILKSRNYKFLMLTKQTLQSTDGFEICMPNVWHKGELGIDITELSMQPERDRPDMDVQIQQKHKLLVNEFVDENTQSLHKKPYIDYRCLHDLDDEGEVHEALPTSMNITCAMYSVFRSGPVPVFAHFGLWPEPDQLFCSN